MKLTNLYKLMVKGDFKMAKIINTNEFNSEVLNGEGVVLVDFYAEWCGPCKMLTPVLEELSTELGGKAKIFKVDVDQSSSLAQDFKVSSVPTMMIFRNGEPMEKLVGFQPKPNLKAKLEYYIQG